MTLKEVILDVLHPTIWKKSTLVWEEVEAYRHKGRRPFGSVSIGSLYVAFDELLSEGLIVRQEAQLTAEESIDRSGRSTNEYRLSEDGLRKRTEEHRGQRVFGKSATAKGFLLEETL